MSYGNISADAILAINKPYGDTSNQFSIPMTSLYNILELPNKFLDKIGFGIM